MGTAADDHLPFIVDGLLKGRVVPFLGAGVNLCGRGSFEPGTNLPSGAELSRHLAERSNYPAEDRDNLLRVTQYIAVKSGTGPLYEDLHSIFDRNYPVSPVHSFLGDLPVLLRKKTAAPRYPLIVTVNYDDLIEQALTRRGEPFDVMIYLAAEEDGRAFVHLPFKGDPCFIDKPNEYTGIPLDDRVVVLKIHGTVDRSGRGGDSFVITEDDYINYLGARNIEDLIPRKVMSKLQRSHFLFLGYSLRDWNLRVILNRIWGERRLTWKSWAVQLAPEEIEKTFWESRDVEIRDARLEDYVKELQARMIALPDTGSAQ